MAPSKPNPPKCLANPTVATRYIFFLFFIPYFNYAGIHAALAYFFHKLTKPLWHCITEDHPFDDDVDDSWFEFYLAVDDKLTEAAIAWKDFIKYGTGLGIGNGYVVATGANGDEMYNNLRELQRRMSHSDWVRGYKMLVGNGLVEPTIRLKPSETGYHWCRRMSLGGLDDFKARRLTILRRERMAFREAERLMALEAMREPPVVAFRVAARPDIDGVAATLNLVGMDESNDTTVNHVGGTEIEPPVEEGKMEEDSYVHVPLPGTTENEADDEDDEDIEEWEDVEED